MKRLIILISGILLLATSAAATATEKPITFNPAIHNDTNLPEGINHMDTGTIYVVTHERVVVNDSNYPFNSKTRVFTPEGLKIARKNLKKGQKVHVFANDNHEAVYIVIK